MDYEEMLECIKKYRDLYPDEACFIAEPNDNLIVTFKGKSYITDDNESKQTFINRIIRSKKANKNLFVDELEILNYKKNVEY